MTSRILTGALIALLAAAASAGCMETRVKNVSSTVLTSENAAQAEYERKQKLKDEESDKGKKEAPKQWTTAEQIEYFKKKAEEEPGEARWNFECGRLYEMQGDEKVNAAARANRPAGFIGDFELAVFRYKRGEELIRNKPEKYTGPAASIGRALAKQGKTDAALGWLREAVNVKPKDLEGYYFNPDYRDSYFWIGAIQFDKKNERESREAFNQYLRLGGDRGHVVNFYPDMVAE